MRWSPNLSINRQKLKNRGSATSLFYPFQNERDTHLFLKKTHIQKYHPVRFRGAFPRRAAARRSPSSGSVSYSQSISLKIQKSRNPNIRRILQEFHIYKTNLPDEISTTQCVAPMRTSAHPHIKKFAHPKIPSRSLPRCLPSSRCRTPLSLQSRSVSYPPIPSVKSTLHPVLLKSLPTQTQFFLRKA